MLDVPSSPFTASDRDRLRFMGCTKPASAGRLLALSTVWMFSVLFSGYCREWLQAFCFDRRGVPVPQTARHGSSARAVVLCDEGRFRHFAKQIRTPRNETPTGRMGPMRRISGSLCISVRFLPCWPCPTKHGIIRGVVARSCLRRRSRAD